MALILGWVYIQHWLSLPSIDYEDRNTKSQLLVHGLHGGLGREYGAPNDALSHLLSLLESRIYAINTYTHILTYTLTHIYADTQKRANTHKFSAFYGKCQAIGLTGIFGLNIGLSFIMKNVISTKMPFEEKDIFRESLTGAKPRYLLVGYFFCDECK